jgi:FkbM family methyltransferase
MLVERMIHGSRMLLHDDEGGLCEDLLWNGTREGNTPHLLAEIVQPGWVVLDIGANIGFYSLIAGKAGAKVYAIEPLPRNAELLRANVELNDYDIEVHELAIGNKNGKTQFNVTAQGNWCSMAEMEARTARPPFVIERITVQETTLNRFVINNSINTVNLLRFDVEGYEVELVQGAQSVIASMPPGSWICPELHMRSFDDPVKSLQPTIDNLANHGFRLEFASLPVKDIHNICRDYPAEAPQVFFQKVSG